MHVKKGCDLDYSDVATGIRIRCFEVLTGERHAFFKDIRSKANLHDFSVWHIDGAIRGRPRGGGKVIFLTMYLMSRSCRPETTDYTTTTRRYLICIFLVVIFLIQFLLM